MYLSIANHLGLHVIFQSPYSLWRILYPLHEIAIHIFTKAHILFCLLCSRYTLVFFLVWIVGHLNSWAPTRRGVGWPPPPPHPSPLRGPEVNTGLKYWWIMKDWPLYNYAGINLCSQNWIKCTCKNIKLWYHSWAICSITNAGVFFTFNHSCEMFIKKYNQCRLNAWARGAVSCGPISIGVPC